MPTILITGGTGLVGTALTQKLLSRGDEVIILSRSPKKSSDKGLVFARWDIKSQSIDQHALLRADHIIHLAGEGIADKRWSEKRKKEIQESRVNSSLLIAKKLAGLDHKIKSVVSASAIGWYGPDKTGKPFVETDPPEKDFLGETCRLWEEAVETIANAGPRVVKLRTGIVLSRRGGALKEFLKPIRLGLTPIMGTGKQVMSWIHIDDLVNLYIHAMENNAMHGSYNAVSPRPVSNKEFIRTVAKARKGFSIPIKIPAPLLRMILGEMSIEVLKSCTVSGEKIIGAGFRFRYPGIELAAKDLFHPRQSPNDQDATHL